jgi:hypothetical protein
VNPFNGIESNIKQARPPVTYVKRWNPFNGIERAESQPATLFTSQPNPFNGIERPQHSLRPH